MWSGFQIDVRSRIEAGRVLMHDLLPPLPVFKARSRNVASAHCMHTLFEAQVERTPDAAAVVHHARVLSYRDLNRRANQIAHHLRKRGVKPDMLVAICLGRRPEMIAALLGVWKAGGAYVPLDPAYPADRLEFMLTDSEACILVTDGECAERLGAPRDNVVSLDDDGGAIYQEPEDNLPAVNRTSHLAYVIYTSGSTGRPKGVMVEHRQLTNYVAWAIEAYGVTAGSSIPVHSSMAFDLTVTSIYPGLLAGASIELLPDDRGAQHLVAALRATKGRSLVKITPAHLELLSRLVTPSEAAGMTDAFVIGGESLPAEMLSFWRKASPATRLFNEYGPTETVVGCAFHEVTTADSDAGPVPIGRPIANTQLYVLDNDLQQVPDGVTGELYIGGAGVARGYLNRAALTAERFVDDPFSGHPDTRLYRTGDLARRRKDGVLEFLGRMDAQVKIRGYRVELGEIEATLSGHPAVQTCAVTVREDVPGDRYLVAYVVTRPAMPVGSAGFLEYLVTRLPEYMCPRCVCVLDTLPLTENGKVDRQALPAPAAEALVPDRLGMPRSTSEALVLRTFQQVLGRADLGVFDDFFQAGGHSLSAARLVSELRTAVGRRLPLRSLFEHPTAEGLAALIDGIACITPEPSASRFGGAWEDVEV